MFIALVFSFLHFSHLLVLILFSEINALVCSVEVKKGYTVLLQSEFIMVAVYSSFVTFF